VCVCVCVNTYVVRPKYVYVCHIYLCIRRVALLCVADDRCDRDVLTQVKHSMAQVKHAMTQVKHAMTQVKHAIRHATS
jgi:hypothetical protein